MIENNTSDKTLTITGRSVRVRSSNNYIRMNSESSPAQRTFKVLNGASFRPDFSNFRGLGSRFLDRMSKHSSKVNQIDATSGLSETHGSVRIRSMMLAQVMINKANVSIGDNISILSFNNMNAWLPVLASFYIGAISNPLNPYIKPETLAYILNLTKPKVLFVDHYSMPQLAEALPNIEDTELMIVQLDKIHSEDKQIDKVIPYDDFLQDLEFKEKLFQCVDIENINETTAVIICTAGATGGHPNLVELSHADLMIQIQLTRDLTLRLDSFLSVVPFNFIGIFLMYLMITDTCGKKIMHPFFSEDQICKSVLTYKANLVFLPHTMLMKYAQYPDLKKYDLSSLRFILTGGTVTNAQQMIHIRRMLPRTMIIQIYGVAEISGYACGFNMEYDKHMALAKPGSTGKVLAGLSLKIVDIITGTMLGPKNKGEICVKGTHMVRYFNNPDLTQQILESDGWVRTGDVGYYDGDGCIFIVGRVADIIIIDDIPIIPSDIAEILLEHPAVIDCAIVGLHLDINKQQTVAIFGFAKIKPADTVTREDLTNFVNDRISPPKKLTGMFFVDTIPRSIYGTVETKELRKIVQQFVMSATTEK